MESQTPPNNPVAAKVHVSRNITAKNHYLHVSISQMVLVSLVEVSAIANNIVKYLANNTVK